MAFTDSYMSDHGKWIVRPVFLPGVEVQGGTEKLPVTVDLYFWYVALAKTVEDEWFAHGITQGNTAGVAQEILDSFENQDSEEAILEAMLAYCGVQWSVASDTAMSEAVAGVQRRLLTNMAPELLETLTKLHPREVRLLRGRLDLDNLRK